MKDDIISALKNVYDPEIPVNIWDLGLVYDIKIDGGKVSVDMTMTSPTCPMTEEIMRSAHIQILKVNGIKDVKINLVWTPAWNPSRMSETAKAELDLTGMGW